MDKQVLYFGKTEQGVFAQALFGSSGVFEKTAGAPPFADWATGDELRKFIRTITKEDRKNAVYTLVNALGAGEYFGSNINSDYFPWDALAHEGDDYGYKTFLRAHAFQHHANKDPARAFGVPVRSILNTHMKRVELIIRLDREQARAQGADGILSRVEKGEFPDVSMGCKVPFDVCSICGHRSKTRDDYCQHMRPPEELRGIYGPNKILPDGRKIYVINLTPRFFDISFVFIGADKTAKVMAKLASRGSHVCLGPVCALPSGVRGEGPELFSAVGDRLDLGELRKVASGAGDRRGPCGRCCVSCEDQVRCETEKLASAFGVKKVAAKKVAEIIKSVPTGVFALKTLPHLEGAEPDIDRCDLDEMSHKPLRASLGASARLGIVLKPHEFQHLTLRRMGEDDLLRDLDEHHKVFRPSREFSDVGMDDKLDAVFDLLKKYIRQRTALGSPFSMRVMMVGGGAKNALPTREPIKHPLLDKVSAAYNGYRRSLLMKLSQSVEGIQSDPRLREAFLADELTNMFTKTSSSPLMSLDSMSYFLGAHFPDRGVLCESATVGSVALNDEWLFGDHISA
jgi:hypothetical protein